MQCHYCEREADITVDKDGLRVGLCEEHFQERLEELSESVALDDLRQQLDVDRT
ncbi:MAG: DUF6757 family protein [Halodesulfurarchaeum sp.]